MEGDTMSPCPVSTAALSGGAANTLLHPKRLVPAAPLLFPGHNGQTGRMDLGVDAHVCVCSIVKTAAQAAGD